MRKVWVIAGREYKASVRTKAFIISLVIMPVLMGGSILIQTLLRGVGETGGKKFAVIDRTRGEKIFPAVKSGKNQPGFIIEHVELKSKDPATLQKLRYELSERVRKKELFGFVEIGPDVVKPVKQGTEHPREARSIRYQTDTPTYQRFKSWIQEKVYEQVKKLRCEEEGVPPDKLEKITPGVPLIAKGLSERDAGGKITDAKDQNQAAAFFVPFGMMMLMFMVLMIGSPPMMQGIVEEKMQKISEVLLGSVNPFQLMTGKILGMVGVSLTLVAVYLGGAYWALSHFGYLEFLPLELIGWFLVFQALAVIMYGSLFIAIGAACTDTKETQSLVMPVMLLAVSPMFVMVNVIQEPNSTFAMWLSLFPFATPMLMVARLAVPPGIELWQPLLAVGLVLATTLLCVYVAGRIFRVGILLQGKGAKFSDMCRWVFRG
jgi:ABC-type Na+ efflux pump permease subunit